jgi:hypothetical protein
MTLHKMSYRYDAYWHLFLLITFFIFFGLFSESCVVLGVVGSIILSVTDGGGGGFGGDSSCGSSNGGCSYVLLPLLYLLVCSLLAHDGHCNLLNVLPSVSY